MKTLNKLILSLVLLSTTKGFAVDEVNNNSYFGFMKNKMSTFASYIGDSRILRYAKNFFSNVSSEKTKKYGFIAAAVAGLSGAAYKYKDKLKNWASKLKDKSFNVYSSLKAKWSGINKDQKRKLVIGAGATAAAITTGAVMYKLYKSKLEKKNKNLEDKKNS